MHALTCGDVPNMAVVVVLFIAILLAVALMGLNGFGGSAHHVRYVRRRPPTVIVEEQVVRRPRPIVEEEVVHRSRPAAAWEEVVEDDRPIVP